MTFVGVDAGEGRSRLRMTGGNLAPRLVRQDATGAKVALVATTALLLGEDRVELDLRVGPGAWLEIVETAGTVAYDAGGAPSWWNVQVTVDAGGMLLWPGEPFVVSDGANTLRHSRFDLAAGAVMCIRETVVLGRSGQVGGAVRVQNRIERPDGPLLVEDLDLRDPATRELPGLAGRASVIDTLTLAGAAVPNAPSIPVGHHFALDGEGAVARVLRSGLAGSPVPGWWVAWSAAARAAHLRPGW
ncbi:urease accessory protein [Nakamurella panacisegetis]|uniref:Urease accessory protein n=1 Tax=Nakamurella panacisegetis TaxID=1090615 RepID=A0A1H0K4G7_9ACTN|nr:urease accessory protein UreD [Nakamurella panacisegetis]SDO50905.1 urease accessory protein [Nakamurella panacisegetis]